VFGTFFRNGGLTERLTGVFPVMCVVGMRGVLAITGQGARMESSGGEGGGGVEFASTMVSPMVRTVGVHTQARYRLTWR